MTRVEDIGNEVIHKYFVSICRRRPHNTSHVNSLFARTDWLAVGLATKNPKLEGILRDFGDNLFIFFFLF